MTIKTLIAQQSLISAHIPKYDNKTLIAQQSIISVHIPKYDNKNTDSPTVNNQCTYT
jgi:hypothetical protein